MKTLIFRIQRRNLQILLVLLIGVYIMPIHAQNEVRDHRTKTSTTKLSKKKVSQSYSAEVMAPIDYDKNQVLYFDEADALFGKRTALIVKPSSFKYTGNRDTIHIEQKFHEGDNSIYKMKSGNTLYANVKNGRIVELVLKDPKRIEIQVQNPYDNSEVVSQAKPVTECLNCKEICVENTIDEEGQPIGGRVCWTQCKKVKCGKHNAILIPERAKDD